ncbi:MAG: PKD domain-containing protein, partial [Planctomycetota bacterium]
ITYNVIRNNQAYVGAGMIVYLGEPTIHNNLIYENSALLGGGLVAFAGDIYNNTIVRNDCDKVVEAPEVGGGQGGNVYIVFAPELGRARVFNNIITGAPSGGGMFWEGDIGTGLVAFNNAWGNVPGNYGFMDPDSFAPLFGGETDQTGLRGNISQDPLFLGSLGRDFHLTLDSPCINAGDPDFVPPAGQTDIDGEDRVYASQIDMGADEYVGYVRPVADAGIAVHVLEPLASVTLDGSESFFYDPFDIRTYQWTQISGPNVVLDAPDSVTPTFSPPSEGEYIFELVVADSQYSSAPDEVLVFVGANQLPVANAGSGRVWQTPGVVTLDGTGSSDPDPVDKDRLTYSWTQVEGPAVTLENGETATPSFAGEPGGIYVFELVVSDGFGDSAPSQVQMVAVGGTTSIQSLDLPPVDGYLPHYLGICGTQAVFAADTGQGYNWRIGHADMATGLSKTFGGSGLNTQPKIEGNLVVWTGDARFANNVLTRECTSIFARDLRAEDQVALRTKSDTQSFSHPAISGDKVVWVQHLDIDKNVANQWRDMPYDICGAVVSDLENPAYFTVATGVGQRDPFPYEDPLNDYDDVVDIDGDIVVWEGDGDIYAADISDLDNVRVFTVCDHEGRQYDPAVSGSYVVWTDERDDDGDIYGADISDLAHVRVFEVIKGDRAQRQPTVEGCLVACVQGEASGGLIKMACITRNYGVMQLDMSGTFSGLGPVLDGTYLAWLAGTYGPIQGARVAFGYSIFDGPIENVTTGARYDYIQHAISDADPGSEIVVPEGVHEEEINFAGKAVTVRSTAPDDPVVVAATVLQGDGHIVTCAEGESATSVLDGLTIVGGSRGVFLSEGSPTIKRCTIASTRGPGMFLVNNSRPELIACRIVANDGDGIAMWFPPEIRTVRHSQPTLRNCVVAGNGGAGIQGSKALVVNCTIAENLREGILCIKPTVTNSIVYFNDSEGAGVQVGDDRASVTYSDVQGGWSGEGNLDVDPAFAQLGRTPDGAWTVGDYHLQSQGRRWNAQAGQWVSDAITSP